MKYADEYMNKVVRVMLFLPAQYNNPAFSLASSFYCVELYSLHLVAMTELFVFVTDKKF